MVPFLILILVLVVGCTGKSSPSQDTDVCTVQCSPGAGPALLASKPDDDDGDGNPRDEDFPRINDEDDDISDHTWVEDKSGVHHLFFHNEAIVAPNAIEHYTTTDFRSLDYVGVALRPDPNGWESGLWAPHIVEHDGTYYMFYTANEGSGPDSKQRIGLATSTDLYTWTRYPINNCPGTSGDGCLYECDEPWTTWGAATGTWNQQCRDPFVIWDETNQYWLMFATTKSTNGYGVVTVSRSANLTQWIGAGFIDATRRLAGGVGAQTTGGQCENPFIMTHDGTNYLLFADWNDEEDSLDVQPPRTQAQYATSNTLDVDSTGSANWIYRGYIPDPAVNAIEVQVINGNLWLMSQRIANPLHPYHERRGELVLKCVEWRANFTFGTSDVTFRCATTSRAPSPVAIER